MARIVIYNIAAEYGGALAILKEYYELAKNDSKNQYLIITGLVPLEHYHHVEVQSYPWAKKNLFFRLYFEIIQSAIIFRQWNADEVINLQNVSLSLSKKPLTIYIHQSLPYSEIRFSLLKYPKYWFYQNIYSLIIHSTARRSKKVIVQTNWMKNALSQKKVASEKITVEPPQTIIYQGNKYETSTNKNNEYKMKFIYPTSPDLYKNYEIIFKSLLELGDVLDYEIIEFVITLNQNKNKIISKYLPKLKEKQVPIKFIGRVPNDEILSYLSDATLVFPSLIESYPIPLLEAMSLNRMILVSDLPYAREILKNYKKVLYFNPLDASSLSTVIIEVIRESKLIRINE